MPNQDAIAVIVASSLVQANANVKLKATVDAVGQAVVTLSPTADYKGTTLRILANSSVAAAVTAKYQVGADFEGDSTFTTWVIFLLSGAFGGAGSITASPIRTLLVSGAFTGSGSLFTELLAAIPMVANSTLTATVKVNRGAHAGILAGSALSASPTVIRPVSILANSSVSAVAAVHSRVHVNIFADSSMDPAPAIDGASMVGTATVAATATLVHQAHAFVLAGSSVAASGAKGSRATVKVMAGSHVAASPLDLPPAFTLTSMVGTSSVAAHASLNHGVVPLGSSAPVLVIILGAQMTGAGTLSDLLLISLAGVLSGAGSIHGDLGIIHTALPLPMVGAGTLSDSIPLPMNGVAVLSGFFEVLRVPRPLCPPRPQKMFRWGYILTRGDLELHVCDTAGNPFGPVVVLYAFYQIVRGGQRMLVGPPNRRPAVDNEHGKPGQYYATGTAGELGQPGEWVVVWRYQRSWWTPTVTVEEHFRVADEVTSCDPGRFYRRHRKYGWL